MTLLMSMLPFYLLGNLHCIGMCGPLALMIGKHRYRVLYFAGRITAFSCAGLIAGEVGAVSNALLAQFHLSAVLCLLLGSMILAWGSFHICGWPTIHSQKLNKRMAAIAQRTSLLMLRDGPLPTFLFGFLTIALPCGQSLIVFSACALSGDLFTGLLNGFVFALLTSPSLFIAMHARALFPRLSLRYNLIMGLSALPIGMLALLRGFAELQLIPHLSIAMPLSHPLILY
jgi:sulfite exporter TauE/SafE